MKIKNIILMIALLLPVFACNKLPGSGSSGEQNNGDIDVNISVVAPLPDQENFVATKSFSDVTIKNMDVLVFDENGKFFRRVKVHPDSLTQTVSGAKFIIRLPATTKKRILHIVANGRTVDGLTDRLNFSSIVGGVHESTAISGLKTGDPGTLHGKTAWTDKVMPLLMWSRVEFNGITLNSKKDNVKLLRSVAAIRVTSESYIKNISFTVLNSAKTGFLTPSSPIGTVAIPSTPRPTGDNSLPYDNAWTETVANPVQYIYERNCSASDHMTIIVKADYIQYGEDITCYYKILLKDASGNPVNIVRNHRYNVKITVDPPNFGAGMGYSNLADALANPPSNGVKVDVHDEYDDFTGIVADQNSFMSLSNTEIVHLAKEGAVLPELLLFTVYSSRNITPVLKKIGNSSSIESLRVVPKGGNKFDVMGKFSQSTINGAASLLVRCDNLVQVVHGIIPNKFTFPMTPRSLVGSLSAHGYTITDYDEAYVVNPDSTPWLRLKKSASDPGEYTSLKKMFSPDAFFSVKNTGSSIGRIDASIKSQISGNDPKQVSVRIYVVK